MTLKEAENRIERLENGLKEIANGRDDMNPIFLKQMAQAILDGEPTTADSYNWVSPHDPGDENSNAKLKKISVGNRIRMSENEESVWREHILHP